MQHRGHEILHHKSNCVNFLPGASGCHAAAGPGFPLQFLGFAYANPVGFPLQSLALKKVPGTFFAPGAQAV
jgi:hypothetical protein